MAIKVGGTSIIDDNKNISNVGIITIGTGGTAGQFNVGTGVTIDGAGNAYFDGYITVNGGINYLVGLTSIYPQDNDLLDAGIYSSWDGNLILYFDSQVEVSAGSTLTVELRKDQIAGPLIATAGISSINYPGGDFSVLEVAFGGISTSFGVGTVTYYPIIPKGIIKFSANQQDYAGNYSGDLQQNEYNFNLPDGGGISFEGGYLICQSGGTHWIVSPISSEVSTNWYSRGAAVTAAQQVSGCTGWFIPESTVLQNPGYICRTFWDSFSSTQYWANSTGSNGYRGTHVSMSTGNPYGSPIYNKQLTFCVRAFRCVTY